MWTIATIFSVQWILPQDTIVQKRYSNISQDSFKICRLSNGSQTAVRAILLGIQCDNKFLALTVCWKHSISIHLSKGISWVTGKFFKQKINNFISSMQERDGNVIKEIKYANPSRPVRSLFINSQYLPGCVHDYSWQASWTYISSQYISFSEVSGACLNLFWECALALYAVIPCLQTIIRFLGPVLSTL